MKRYEKYWTFAILWMFLADRDSSQDETWQLIASTLSYFVAICYLVASPAAYYTDRKKDKAK